jgi:molecular chaperone DnaK
MASDNKMLGQFDLVGLPPAPRGIPQVEVTFDIDANGIVNVSAQDKATGKEQSIRIQASGGLSDDDIDKMVQEAEIHADEDKQRRSIVEARNGAEALVHSTQKTLEEVGDKVSEADRSVVEQAMEDLNSALEGEDAEDIQKKSEALAQASMKLGEALYQNQPGDDDANEPGNQADGNEDVVDADFEEINDDENDKDDEDDQKKAS